MGCRCFLLQFRLFYHSFASAVLFEQCPFLDVYNVSSHVDANYTAKPAASENVCQVPLRVYFVLIILVSHWKTKAPCERKQGQWWIWIFPLASPLWCGALFQRWGEAESTTSAGQASHPQRQQTQLFSALCCWAGMRSSCTNAASASPASSPASSSSSFHLWYFQFVMGCASQVNEYLCIISLYYHLILKYSKKQKR